MGGGEELHQPPGEQNPSAFPRSAALVLPWRLEFVPGCFSRTYFLRAVVEQVLGSFMAAMAERMASSIRLPPSNGFSPDFFSWCHTRRRNGRLGQEEAGGKERVPHPTRASPNSQGSPPLPTWKVPEAPLPVICSSWPFSTARCRAFFSSWGLKGKPQRGRLVGWSCKRGRAGVPSRGSESPSPHPWLLQSCPFLGALPDVHLQLGVILGDVFFDQAVGGLLGLAEAGEGQRENVLQLHVLLCAGGRQAPLREKRDGRDEGSPPGGWQAEMGLKAPLVFYQARGCSGCCASPSTLQVRGCTCGTSMEVPWKKTPTPTPP